MTTRRLLSLTALLLIAAWPTTAAHAQTPVVSTAATTATSTLTLEAAYDRVLATDQSIGIALSQERKADLLPWSALTRMGPSLSANASYIKPKDTLTGPLGLPILAEGNEESLTVQQTLFDPTIFAAYRGGRLSAQAAGLQRKFAARAALFGLAQAYFGVLKQERIVAENQQALALARQQLYVAQKRFDVGEVTRTDVLRAQVALSKAERALTEADDPRRLAQAVLNNILNYPPDEPLTLADPGPAAAPALTMEAESELAMTRRDDLRAAALAVDEAQEKRRETGAQYGPKLVGQWNYVWISPQTLSQRNDFWTGALAVQLPLFTGGQREVDLRNARENLVQARLDYANRRKSVDADVRSAWLRVHTLRHTLASLEAEVAAAQANYDDLSHRYRVAEATSLDVDTAFSELVTARADLAAQTYDYQVALRNLELSTGVFQQQRVEKGARQ